MFDLYGINKYIKEIEIPQSEMFLNSISEEQKEKVKNIILKAKMNALENLKKQLKSKENKVKSLQKQTFFRIKDKIVTKEVEL